jgi:hypothetical protein
LEFSEVDTIFHSSFGPGQKCGFHARQNQFSQIAQGRKQIIQKEANDILVLYYSLSGNTDIKETQWDFRPGLDQKGSNSKRGGTAAISNIK